jgi:CRISPR/Cas system-associated exonuclease Cas4 (RecB family)
MSSEINKQPLYFYPHQYISVSALNAFESCPMTFYLRYYCGVKWPQTEAMLLGTQFQEALNAVYEEKDPKDIIESIVPKHRAIAKSLIKKANSFDGIVSIDSEYIEDFGLGIPVKFIPDLLTLNDDVYTVIENKYTSGYYNKNTVQTQHQGTVYYYGIKKMFNKDVKVKYQIFNHKKKTVDLIDVSKNGIEVSDMLNWMDRILYRIKLSYESDNWMVKQHARFRCNLGDSCLILKL